MFQINSLSFLRISQTSINVAGEIIKVIEELRPDKCVGVVTDNASNMQGAWKIIEDKFPKIHCNGCASALDQKDYFEDNIESEDEIITIDDD
jgi:hypothetical protein